MNTRNRLSNILIYSGVGFLLVSVAIVVLTFYPVIREEFLYLTRGSLENSQVLLEESQAEENTKAIVPEDPNFGVVIPKIRANTNVIPGVDPYDEEEYQLQLSRGVAHADGSALPDEAGNVFLFAHSAGNFYEANRYNAVFYLLNKLQQGDDMYVFYEKQRYRYIVTETKIVEADEVEYLSSDAGKNQLTLMTCWPAGTTLQRLLVIGERVETVTQ